MGLETGTYLNDLNVANPVGASDLLAQGDDHIRLVKSTLKNTFPNMGGAAWRVQSKGSNYTLAATDNMSVIRGTASITLATEAAATIGNGFIVIVVGDGGDVVIDPNGAETVNGNATLTVLNNSAVVLYCNGSLFYALQLMIPNGVGLYLPAGQSITFEGTTADAFELTVSGGEPTADRTQTHPDMSGTIAVQARGADVASASTINLTTATGDIVDVTGTTAITTITLADGIERKVRFTGALTLTHGASLILPSSANITTAAGDFATFRGYEAGVVRCTAYQPASGAPVSGASVFTNTYDSGEQTISTSGALDLTHSLGAIPKVVMFTAKCLTGELGFSVGDELYLGGSGNAYNGAGSSNRQGFSATLTATKIYIRFSDETSALGTIRKDSGDFGGMTNANWAFVVRAYA